MHEPEVVLDRGLIDDILRYLGITAGRRPDLALLDDLVAAYVRRVPWESASRIEKKARVLDQTGSAAEQACARWPAEFWSSAIGRGTGGTCFESNYAFFTLLYTLGFSGHLTVNNMDPTIGCHAAIVVELHGVQWLADVGLPLYVPLPLASAKVTGRQSPFHHYTVRPIGSLSYVIERDRHPQAYCFTLIDQPVLDSAYREILAGDYGSGGFFLDRVIVSKVIAGQVCRFVGDEQPFVIERFGPNDAGSIRLGDDPAGEVGRFFNLDERLLRQALQAAGIDNSVSGTSANGPQSHAE